MVTKLRLEKFVQIVATKRSEMEITSAVVVDSGIRHLKMLNANPERFHWATIRARDVLCSAAPMLAQLAPTRSRSRTKVRADSRCLPTADYISLHT